MKRFIGILISLTLLGIPVFFLRPKDMNVPNKPTHTTQISSSSQTLKSITDSITANNAFNPIFEDTDKQGKETPNSFINERIEKKEPSNEFTLNLSENPYQALFQENTDFVGWINIEDTPIDYPVVKASDNDFYLKRNFNKKKDFYGSIFMDYRNFGIGLDKNTIIYGHNMKDGKMFGNLPFYSDESYALAHSIIQIDTLYGTKKYKVFSVYFDEADSSLIQTQFNENEFDSYIAKLIQKSSINFSQEITSHSQILTLVTCSYEVDDGRYYLHAVEI